jgi:hypothetical protein
MKLEIPGRNNLDLILHPIVGGPQQFYDPTQKISLADMLYYTRLSLDWNSPKMPRDCETGP